VYGLAGADTAADTRRLHTAIEAEDLAATSMIVNDAFIPIRAGTDRTWGVALICGSGVNAAGIAPDGRTARLTALGDISGDWGGGGDMALAAIGAVARAWDGRGPATALTERVLARFGMASYEALLEAIYTGEIPRQRIREIAPLIFEAALAGDAVAQEIIVRTGTEIGHAAGSLLRRLDMHRGPCEVVTGGSIFKGVGPLLLDAANLSLHRLAPLARFTRATVEPVVGALLLAIELHGQTVDSKLMARLHETMPAHLFTHR
jgi:N-acetylglucosamine kinase-like BadF-type ATPase